MATLRLKAGGLQSGTVSRNTGAGVTTTDVSITAVDTTKSVLHWTSRGGDANPEESCVSGYFLDSDTIRFETAVAQSPVGENLDIVWFVEEFDSAAGIAVQHHQTTLTAATSATETLDTIDLATTYVIPSGTIKTGGTYGQDDYVRIELTSTTQATVTCGVSSTITTNYQVVDVDDCDVQYQEFTNASATATTFDQTLDPVVELAAVLAFGSYTVGSSLTGFDDNNWSAYFGGDSSLTLARNTGGSATFTFGVYFASFTEAGAVTVEQGRESLSAGTTSVDVALTTGGRDLDLVVVCALVLVNGSSLWATSHAGDDTNLVSTTLSFPDTDNIRIQRDAATSSSIEVSWQVAEFVEASSSTPVEQTFALEVEVLTGLSKTAAIEAESLGALSATKAIESEVLTGLSATKAVEAEVLTGLSRASALEAESLGGIAKTAAIEAESLGAISATRALEAEVLTGLSTTKAIEAEVLTGLSRAAALEAEVLTGLGPTFSIEVEVLGVAVSEVFQDFALEIEVLGGVAGTRSLEAEVLGGVARVCGIEAESLGAVVRTVAAEMESLTGVIGATVSAELEALQRLARLFALEVESAATIATIDSDSAEILAAALDALQIELLTDPVTYYPLGVGEGLARRAVVERGLVRPLDFAGGRVLGVDAEVWIANHATRGVTEVVTGRDRIELVLVEGEPPVECLVTEIITQDAGAWHLIVQR